MAEEQVYKSLIALRRTIKMTETQNMIVIGTVDQINAVLKCINPNYPTQDLKNLEKNQCFYTMNGVGVEVILKE